MYKGEATTLYKYSYDASTQTYTRLAGFPVAIPLLAGSESATITQDSTGNCGLPMIQRSPSRPPDRPPPAGADQLDRLNEIHALWSVDHTTWDVMNNRGYWQSPVCDDDLAALVAVSFKDRIGVMWSDQTVPEPRRVTILASASIGMRTRIQRAGRRRRSCHCPRTLIADDHIHLTVTERGDIIAATKSSTVATDANGNPILDEEGEPIDLNEINLFVRWHDGKPARHGMGRIL